VAKIKGFTVMHIHTKGN